MARAQVLLIDDRDELFERLNRDAKKEHFILIQQRSDLSFEKVLPLLTPKLIMIGEVVTHRTPLELCTLLRQHTVTPILMTLGGKCTMQKVIEAGANDFLSLPLDYEELLMRTKAHINHDRRLREHQLIELQLKGLSIDLISQKVLHHHNQVHLSAQEFKLLSFLVHRPTTVFSSEQLFFHLWEDEGPYDSATIMVHISNIRKKLPPIDSEPSYIKTIRGVGYTIDDFYC